MPFFSEALDAVRSSSSRHRILPLTRDAIILGPLAILGFYLLLLLVPFTRNGALWGLEENHPVEVLTFGFALTGGLIGARLVLRSIQRKEDPLTLWFYLLFSLGIIFIAGEEIAWGQQFFGFATPEEWKKLNFQGETTLHNIVGLQSHSDMIRTTFGLCGLAGVWLSVQPRFRRIGAPVILSPWFLLISAHSLLDVYNDFFPINVKFDFYVQRLSELVEMMIGIAGMLFLWLNSRMLSSVPKE